MSGPKVLAGRFSKARVLRDLRDRQEVLRAKHGFSGAQGYSQILGKDPLIVGDYWRYRECETLIGMIEAGQLGYGD